LQTAAQKFHGVPLVDVEAILIPAASEGARHKDREIAGVALLSLRKRGERSNAIALGEMRQRAKCTTVDGCHNQPYTRGRKACS
jgi:hypothetical protein